MERQIAIKFMKQSTLVYYMSTLLTLKNPTIHYFILIGSIMKLESAKPGKKGKVFHVSSLHYLKI